MAYLYWENCIPPLLFRFSYPLSHKKYSDIEQKNELDRIEERGNEIKLNEGDDFKKKIWADIYSDVLELEKNTVKKNKPQKKKKSDNKR